MSDPVQPTPAPEPCCTGINGSHAFDCPAQPQDFITCWCCGGIERDTSRSMFWSQLGARCFWCAEHDGCLFTIACHARVGQVLAVYRVGAAGQPI